MINEALIEGLISDKLTADEVYVVDLKVRPGNKIVLEVDSFKGIPISYCIELSKHIEAQLDRDVEDFELEVASAGIGQPFKVMNQYKKNINREVEVLSADGKKMKGQLTAVSDEGFTIEIEEMVKIEGKKRKEKQLRTVTFAFDEVKQVKDIISF